MQGRHPKPAALKRAQGNPGKRKIIDDPIDQLPATAIESSSANVAAVLPWPAAIADQAQKIYDLVAGELRRLNFLKSSDEIALRRYCEIFARYWMISNEMGGEHVYECKTTTGETMKRWNPLFILQDRLGRRLDAMESSFGLTPAARQQYILALSRQGDLGLPPPAPRAVDAQPHAALPPAIGVPRAPGQAFN